MEKLEVREINIPKIKNEYLTDFRTVRFGNSKEYWIVDCFMGGHDLFVNDKVELSIRPMTDCNPSSLCQEHQSFYENYICVSASYEEDGYYSYEFYRATVVKSNIEIKPYSTIFGKTKDKFTVGESYVLCYKKVN